MVLTKAINKLFDDSLRSSDTTILVPRLAESRHHYQDNPRIFYSDDLGIKIFSPEGWTISCRRAREMPQTTGNPLQNNAFHFYSAE